MNATQVRRTLGALLGCIGLVLGAPHARATCPAIVELSGADGPQLYGLASDARVMSIYFASEFPCDGGTIVGVSCYMIGTYTMDNLTVRLQETNLSALTNDSFINTGWTLCYHANRPIAPGWQTFMFSTPFAYTPNVSPANLLADFSYNSSTAPGSETGLTTYGTGDLRTLMMACNNCVCPTSADPLNWTTCTECARFAAVPRVRFIFGGACCHADGNCGMTTQADCTGSWLGLGTTCSPNPCPQPGACCFTDGSCTLVLQSACTGTWHGEWSTCSPNPCPQPTGACCFPDGSCTLVTQANCSGVWQGAGTTCTPTNPCPPPTGACCVGLLCTMTQQSQCGGTWMGPGVICTPVLCESLLPGACCFSDGTCQILHQSSCSGIWHGEWTTCWPNPCPQVCAGDMNCDKRVTFADIDPFVEALAGESAWIHHHPDCPWLNADCNHDKHVNFADIDPFVAVIGTICP